MSLAAAVPASSKPRITWRRRLLWLALLAVLGYLVVLGVLMAMEDSLVYSPIPAASDWRDPPSDQCQDVELHAPDGTRLHAWWLPHPRLSGALLFCHGKSGNVSLFGKRLQALEQSLGVSVLAIDYPGFGRSGGQPSEAGCYTAAGTAYDWLTETQRVRPDQVLLYGESLGGGVAVELASKRPHRALVLVMTFTSLPDVGQHLVPFVPAHWIMRNRFDSLAKIGKCRRPVFIAHGSADSLVPFTLGQRLFTAANEPKEFFAVEGGGHGGLEAAFLPALGRFLDEHEPMADTW